MKDWVKTMTTGLIETGVFILLCALALMLVGDIVALVLILLVSVVAIVGFGILAAGMYVVSAVLDSWTQVRIWFKRTLRK
jgi:hypothetical protein